MRVEVIRQLAAPGGGAPLDVASVARCVDREIESGAVFAPGRGLYSILDGVIDFLPRGPGSLSVAQRSNQLLVVARGYEWPWRSNSLTILSGRPLSLTRERAIFIEMLGEQTGGLWLDLAASTALYGRWLAPEVARGGGEVIALDLAWPMLREARRRIRAEGRRNLSLVRARAEALPFADGSLQGIVCGGSLNEFGAGAVDGVLAEVGRTLRGDGVALFMHLLTRSSGAQHLFQRFIAGPGGIAFWSRDDTNRLFAAAGLAVEEVRDFGAVGFTLVRKA